MGADDHFHVFNLSIRKVGSFEKSLRKNFHEDCKNLPNRSQESVRNLVKILSVLKTRIESGKKSPTKQRIFEHVDDHLILHFFAFPFNIFTFACFFLCFSLVLLFSFDFFLLFIFCRMTCFFLMFFISSPPHFFLFSPKSCKCLVCSSPVFALPFVCRRERFRVHVVKRIFEQS